MTSTTRNAGVRNARSLLPLWNVPRRHGGRRLARTVASALILAIIASILPFGLPGVDIAAAEAGEPPVEVYYVALPDEHVRSGSYALATTTGSTIHTVISITVTAPGTVVYYDHWEDGFELDLGTPVQASTRTWGDGDAANGAPPGCAADGCDVLAAGDNIILENDVPANPRNPNTILFDGRDRFGTTAQVAVTRAGWATTPGVLLAGAVEVYPSGKWGNYYEVPAGENLTGADNFEYTAASIMAERSGTSVTIDVDGDGAVDQAATLGAGQAMLVEGFFAGGSISSSAPVQVHLLTGDVGATYEGRWFALIPTVQWSGEYYNPVGTTAAGHPTYVLLYNPGASTISVTVTSLSGTSSVNVPAGGTATYSMPLNSGARFSSPSTFFALGVVDWDVTTSDWGFTLLPDGNLATAGVVGWAPGSENPSAENSSPIWVTAVAPTNLYVDYDGDPATGALTDPNGMRYDRLIAVGALESTRVYDTGDNDQTGTKVYTVDGTLIAMAWGQDPATASPAAPALDLGTTVVPFVSVAMGKVGDVTGDENGNGALDAGDTITYTITARNDGTAVIDPAVLTDELDINTTYVPNTTVVDGVLVPDAGATPFPVDEGGLDLGAIAPGQLVIISYDVMLNDPLPPDVGPITNRAGLGTNIGLISSAVALPVFEPSVEVVKTSDAPAVGLAAGDTVTYTITATNTSAASQSDVTIQDALPGGTTYVAESTSVTGPVVTVSTYGDNFSTGGFGGSTGSSPWDPDWVEVNESDGAGSGDIRVMSHLGSNALRLQDRSEGARRAVNLAAFDTVTMIFDYSRSGLDDANDYVSVQASSNGTTWTELDRIAGPGTDPIYRTMSVDLTGYRTAGAAIRFLTSNTMGGSDAVFIDNVVIEGTTVDTETRTNQTGDPTPLLDGTPPTLVMPADLFSLPPGESISVTFQAVVDEVLDPSITEITNRAFVATDLQPTFDVSEVTDPVARPSLALAKTLAANADEDGSNSVSVGDTLQYEFTAVNDGDLEVSGVAIDDPLPGLSSLSCAPLQPTTLVPGATLTCTATYVVTQADVDAGGIVNTATVEGTAPHGAPVADPSTATTPINRVGSVTVVKSLETDPTGIGAGDTLDYAFTITNTGTATLDAITVDDPLTGGAVACPQTMLAPGELMTCSASYTVTQSEVDAGRIENTATVDAIDPDGEHVVDGDSELVLLERNPSITLSKSRQANADEDGSGDVTLGDTLTYGLVARNSGDVTLTGVGVSDPLPGLSALTCAPAQPATLAPGAAMSCTATYSVTQADLDAGEVANTATASGLSPSGITVTDQDADVVNTAQNPSIDGLKSFAGIITDLAPLGEVSIGDEIEYSFAIENNGNVTLTLVDVFDPMPGLSAPDCAPATLPITLAPDETVNCAASYTVTLDDVNSGRIDNSATFTGVDPNGTTITDTDTETVFPDRNLSIDLTKVLSGNADEDGSGSVSVGDTLTFSFVAENDGDVTLDATIIVDSLPGISPLSCTPAQPASLDPGDILSCTATYTVTQGDVDAGSMTNDALATGEDSGGGGSVGDDDSVTLSIPQNPSISLDKTFAGNADEDTSGTLTLGDTVTYQFVVTNTGGVTLSAVALDDPLVGGPVSCPESTVAPADSMTCTATYAVTQSDVDAGSIDNTANVVGTGPSGRIVSDTDSESLAPPQNPSISLLKTLTANADEDGSDDVSVGDTLTYGFAVSNDGNVGLSTVTVSDPLAGLSPLACTPSQPASLGPNETMACTATLIVTQSHVDSGSIANTASVSAERPGGLPGQPSDDITDTSTVTIDIPPLTIVQLDKTLQANADEDASGDVSVGDTLTYEFAVTNSGNVTLSAIVVDDPQAGPVSCAATSLSPSAATTCTASHVVTVADADGGWIVNTATVTATAPRGEIATDDATAITAVAENPAVSLSKHLESNADEDASGDISLGDTLTYSFAASNTGDVTLSAVRVVDPLPGLSAITCTPSQPAALAPGEGMTCTATYSVTQSDVDAAQIFNTASVDGLAPSGSLVRASDSEVTPIAQAPALALTKSVIGNADEDGSGGVSLGDTLTYRFSVTNTGNVMLVGVSVADPLPGLSGIGCTPSQPASLAIAESMTCTATYTVTQTDVDAGFVTNTATADGATASGATASDTGSTTVLIANPPTAVDDAATTDEDTSVVVDVLSNDSDVDGNLDPTSVSVTSGPSNGSTAVDPVTGEITYAPEPDFAGTDSFTYEVCDTGSPALCDTAIVTVTVDEVNDPPVAVDDGATTDEDAPVTVDVVGNDSDLDGVVDPTTVVVVTGPPNGSISVSPVTGAVTYTPDPDFTGTDSFSYQVCDDGTPVLCDTATVTIDLQPVNDPPVANDDTAETDEETPVTVDVVGNDTDIDGAVDPTTVVVTSGPGNGTISVDPVTGEITYTPGPDFVGTTLDL